MTRDLTELASRLGRLASHDAPLGARTTYRVGGTASLLVEARTPDHLAEVVDALRGLDVEVLVVGRGSNLLVSDAGFEGLAVVLAGSFESIDVHDKVGDGDAPSVRAGGAVALPVLARRLADLGLRGLEWAVGVPGSVGGAVAMNAGGHGSDTAATLLEAELLDLRDGSTSRRDAEALGLAYRHSDLSAPEVVVAATHRLVRGDREAAKAEVADVVRWRREHQPGGSNAGSVFTNPEGDHAGRLVEASGAKGLRVRTAAVSDKHANFIQADTGGSADDVLALITEVQALVEKESGVALRTEVVLVGFEGRG